MKRKGEGGGEREKGKKGRTGAGGREVDAVWTIGSEDLFQVGFGRVGCQAGERQRPVGCHLASERA